MKEVFVLTLFTLPFVVSRLLFSMGVVSGDGERVNPVFVLSF